MLVRDLALMADAVYDLQSLPNELVRIDMQAASGTYNGFQAAAYMRGGGVGIIFRGTTVKGDALTDAALGVGINSAYYSQAETFTQRVLRQVAGAGEIVVAGHSLGGAIAQVIANRMELPMMTFNAPGVAVFASKETASPGLTAVRAAGMVASAIIRPGQALADIRSAFNKVRGLNICLEYDVVSRYGLHYGPVQRIKGTSHNPLQEHRMTTVRAVLAQHVLGSRPIQDVMTTV